MWAFFVVVRACVWVLCGYYFVWVIDTMGFTVCPRSHVVCPPCDSTVGTDAMLPVDAGRFSDDLSEFVYFGQVVTVDPFSAAVVDGVGVNSVGEGGVCGGELGDFL